MATADDLKYAPGWLRRAEALRMRADGKKLREIGAVLGVSVERVRQLIARANREAKAGYRYRHHLAKLEAHEVEVLLPLLDFLRHLSDDNLYQESKRMYNRNRRRELIGLMTGIEPNDDWVKVFMRRLAEHDPELCKEVQKHAAEQLEKGTANDN